MVKSPVSREMSPTLGSNSFDPSMAQLAELLGQHFTVYNYDRRGRGDSGDTQPFAQGQAIWSGVTGVAHTNAYDVAFVGNVMQGKPLPTDRWVKVTVPVLVADGGASDAWIQHGADALANVLPHASRQTLEGQTHMVDPKVLAPAIIEFFNEQFSNMKAYLTNLSIPVIDD